MTICGKDIPGKANTHAKAPRAYSVYLMNSKKASVVTAKLRKRILVDDGIRQVTQNGLYHKNFGFYCESPGRPFEF